MTSASGGGTERDEEGRPVCVAADQHHQRLDLPVVEVLPDAGGHLLWDDDLVC